MDERHQIILTEIEKHLTSEDDRAAWFAVLDRILPEADYLCAENPDNKFIELEIGCCSRWLRPH